MADERVTTDDNIRIRIDCQSVSVSADRLTTSRRLANCSREDVVGNITINCQVAYREGRISIAFHQFIVTVPSEDVRESFNTFAGVSGNGNLTTFANLIDREFDGIDNRIRMREDGVKTVGFTSRVGLEYADEEDRRIINRSSIRSLRGAPNLVSRISTVLVPSVRQGIIVVVAEVSSQRHLTTFADVVFSGSDFNNDSVIYIYIIRSAFCTAAVRIVHNNRVNVSVILRTADINDGVVCSSCFANCIVVEQPCVGQLSTHIIVSNISREHNHAILADNRVSSNNHCRVRINRQCIRSEGSDRLTARRNLRNICTINIGSNVSIRRKRAFCEGRVCNTLHQFSISEPSEDIFI